MRQIVFRSLSGLLAVLFSVFLASGDLPDWSLPRRLGAWVITIGLALHSVRPDFGEHFLAMIFGIDPDRQSRPPGSDDND